MKTKLFATLIVLFFTAVTSYADDVPRIVLDGLNAYKSAGFTEAFNVWLKGSPMESDKTTTMNLKGGFTQIESIFGKMIGYDVLKTTNISPVTNRTYIEINYEKGPLFLYFDNYKSPSGWIIPTMKFHTEADKILPSDMINGK
ncbi:MAG TPA: hypothetical protein VEM40_08505 [Nitrospirota bacterium]|nr:hypothetical protein [Nitrospirota bacterium]